MTDLDPSRAISYWLAASPPDPPRPAAGEDPAADVAIIGAGFTGLWTAIALTDTDPASQSRPIPFPPEPLRWLTVETLRRELDRADRNEGRRGPILRTLDALGIGYDS